MGCLNFYLLTAVFCTVIVFGRSEDIPRPKTVVVPIPVVIPGSQNPSTASDDTSDSKPPQPSTDPSIITTEAISTDTSEPTTDATTKSSTTTTTTTPPTTTTPTTTTPTTTTPTTTTPTTTPPTTEAPITTTTAKPEPQEGTWSYPKDSNVSCILVQFAAELNVTYSQKVNDSTSLAYKVLNVPKTANVTDGACGNTTQWLTISWFTNNDTNASLANNLTLVFVTNATTKTYELQYLNVSLAQDNFPNATSKIAMTYGPAWNVPVAASYRCEPTTELNLTNDTKSVVAVMRVTHLQEEAFRTTPGTGFSAPRECGGADVPDAVPIAVGCALGALVLVVLVAYLVARRRSAARGYLSM